VIPFLFALICACPLWQARCFLDAQLLSDVLGGPSFSSAKNDSFVIPFLFAPICACLPQAGAMFCHRLI
jgi:hypothetical protein